MAPAASSPATAAGTRPVASRPPWRPARRSPASRPGPIGTAWRRTSSGESTTSTSGSSRCSSSAFQVPCSSSVSPAAQHGLARARGPRPRRCTARTTRSPLGRDHAREHRLRRSAPERGGITTSARPELRLNSVSATSAAASSARKARCLSAARRADRLARRRARAGGRPRPASAAAAGRPRRRPGPRPGSGPDSSPRSTAGRGAPDDRANPRGRAAGTAPSSSPYCSTSVRACRLRSAGIVAAAALRQQALAEQHDDRHGAEQQRHADQANSKKPKAPSPASTAASETSTFTGVPVSASSEPAWPANTSGISSCDGGRPQPHRHDHDHRQQRRDRAVDADQRGQHRDQQHHQDEQPRPALARLRGSGAGRPRRSRRSRRAPALTTNSEAMKITAGSPKPASAWPRSSTPVAQSASAVAMRDDDHRQPVPDEQDHDRGDDREGDRDVTQDLVAPACIAASRVSSQPVPVSAAARRDRGE